MKSKCADDIYPDYWFPELRRGAKNESYYKQLAVTIDYAMDKCNACPIKQECYEMGMEKANLPYGIWGGVLAGERLRSIGHTLTDVIDFSQPVDKALHLERTIKPYLKGQHEKTISSSDGATDMVRA